jgi:predicted  nucleic acid-binding Zn-ribbon protein
MQTMESPSTEKRMDDLNARMTEGFGRVHREIDGLNERMTDGFQRVDQKFKEVDARMTEGFKRVDRQISRLDGDIRELRRDVKDLRSETSVRFDAMHRTMMRGFFALGGITVTLFLALAGLQGF